MIFERTMQIYIYQVVTDACIFTSFNSEFVKRIMAIVKDEIDEGPVNESATRGSLAPLSKKRNGKVSHDRVKAKSGRNVNFILNATKHVCLQYKRTGRISKINF